MDCEYFVSKKHIERMIENIAFKINNLKEGIKKSYPQTLTPDSLIISLN